MTIKNDKYAEVRNINARNYYWKRKGKDKYYYIQRDCELLQRKLKGIEKIAKRLSLKIEINKVKFKEEKT